MKECIRESEDVWFIIYKTSQWGHKFQTVKAKGMRKRIIQDMREHGLFVSMTFTFDALYEAQQMDYITFNRVRRTYKEKHYNYIMKIDIWDDYMYWEELKTLL